MGFDLNVKCTDCSHQETINTREMKASTLPPTEEEASGTESGGLRSIRSIRASVASGALQSYPLGVREEAGDSP